MEAREELNFDNVQRGLIQKAEGIQQQPAGQGGEYVFNMRKPPFDDIRVRKAMTLLLNRKLIVDKIMFNQYRAYQFLQRRYCLRESQQSQE